MCNLSIAVEYFLRLAAHGHFCGTEDDKKFVSCYRGDWFSWFAGFHGNVYFVKTFCMVCCAQTSKYSAE